MGAWDAFDVQQNLSSMFSFLKFGLVGSRSYIPLDVRHDFLNGTCGVMTRALIIPAAMPRSRKVDGLDLGCEKKDEAGAL